MTLAQLKALVKRGESEVLEFKKTTGSLDGVMRTVCAFLNSDVGGTVLIGVTDDGKIMGQEVPDKVLKGIAVELSKIDPYVKIKVTYIPVKEKLSIIAFNVVPGPEAPYHYDGRSYMRIQSTTTPMSQEASWYLFNKKRPTRWEKEIASDCTIDSLDKDQIQEVIRIAIAEKRLRGISARTSIIEMLTKLNLVIDKKLTNAAVILFYKGKRVLHFGSHLQLARFNGTDKREFLDNKSFHGNAFEIYEKAMEFMGNHLPIAGKIEHGNPYRVDTLALPYEALREAIVNAICHRNYSMHGASIMLAIYDDRIEIDNPGNLPPGLSISQLKRAHRSIPRNELIAHVFYLCHMVERWGRGTTDMVSFCKKAGVPEPKFEDNGSFFTVTLRFKEPIRYVQLTDRQQSDILAELTKRQKLILEILGQGNSTSQEIMEKMDTPLTPRTIQQELAKLRDLKLIIPAGKGTRRTIIWGLAKS